MGVLRAMREGGLALFLFFFFFFFFVLVLVLEGPFRCCDL